MEKYFLSEHLTIIKQGYLPSFYTTKIPVGVGNGVGPSYHIKINKEVLQEWVFSSSILRFLMPKSSWKVSRPAKANDVAVLQMVHENILGSYERFLLDDEELVKENYQDLCDIIEAIEQGESEKARLVAQNHIRRFDQHMKQID